jgi:transmembrane sensor
MRLDPVAEASEFFVEFRVGDITPAVRTRFEKWLRASPEHIQAYLEVAAGWSELPTADPEVRIDLQALLAAARDSDDDNVVHLRSSQADAGRASTPHHAQPWAIAASLALISAVIGAGLWLCTPEGRTYTTGIGEQRTLMLADGTTVILNALTTVRVHITKEARMITLIRGQAYFHDRDEPDRPFIVRSGTSTVRAIGTEFDVNNESDRTVVTVLDGQVAVAKSLAWIGNMRGREYLRNLAESANKAAGVLVPAGEQVTVLQQTIPPPTPADVTAVTAWMQQRLIFDATPLEKVAQQFNLYSKRRLVIADPSLKVVGVSGVYSAADPSALIGFLRSQPTLYIVETDDQIVVTTRRRK